MIQSICIFLLLVGVLVFWLFNKGMEQYKSWYYKRVLLRQGYKTPRSGEWWEEAAMVLFVELHDGHWDWNEHFQDMRWSSNHGPYIAEDLKPLLQDFRAGSDRVAIANAAYEGWMLQAEQENRRGRKLPVLLTLTKGSLR